MRRYAGTAQRPTEHGTVLLMATVTILVVVGMLALAVDVGYLMSGRGQLQNIMDASALAAAQGLRVAIESPGNYAEQETIVRKLARDMALFNPLRQAGGLHSLALSDDDIRIEYPANYPIQPARVVIHHRLALPTIFGNVFGVASMNVSAVAIANTTVVDGGTGLISGCWRPILIPDTFYASDGQVWAICDPDVRFDNSQACRPRATNGDDRTRANITGDYYVSRFASNQAGSERDWHNQFTQEIAPSNITTEATSIRDAFDQSELKYVNGILTGRNLIGQRIQLRFDPNEPTKCDWRIVNFSASGITGNFPADPMQQINKGCCTPIRVGKLVQVYADPTGTDLSLYQGFIQQLLSFRNSFPASERLTPSATRYRYEQTTEAPTPNAHPRVIPVLMCSPIEFSNSPAISQFHITNIGAFYLESVRPNGLVGYFVREVMAGGTPLEPENGVENSGLLPVSVRLSR
ncbi:MAG: Tad domain-containing protein [Blastocatellia bacterium]